MNRWRVLPILVVAGMLTACEATPKKADQVTEALSVEGRVDVDARNAKNHAQVVEMSSSPSLSSTQFKFKNETRYRVWMIVKTPYGKWQGWIDPWGETGWTTIQHDGTAWAWGFGYRGGVQEVSWECATISIRPGVKAFEFTWRP